MTTPKTTPSPFTSRKSAPGAKKRKPPFAILDFAEMSDEQKTAALAGFSLESYAPRIRLGQTVRDIKSEAASAASLVASYY
jgi:hypothetical protein